MQCLLRANGNDEFSGEKAHRYGTSTGNQRIECWWSHLKKSRTTWWINFFKDLVDRGVFLPGYIYTTMNASGFVLMNFCSMTWILLCCIGIPTISDNPDMILRLVDQMNYSFYPRGLVERITYSKPHSNN